MTGVLLYVIFGLLFVQYMFYRRAKATGLVDNPEYIEAATCTTNNLLVALILVLWSIW